MSPRRASNRDAPSSPGTDEPPDREAYVEAVLAMVEQIPAGAVCTYGDVAELVGRGGPRNVGQVMSLHGGAVPWWRVVRADGRPAAGLEDEALARLRADDVVLRGDRVDLRRARWTGPDGSDGSDVG